MQKQISITSAHRNIRAPTFSRLPISVGEPNLFSQSFQEYRWTFLNLAYLGVLNITASVFRVNTVL